MAANGLSKVYFDGGCRPNPGLASCAVVMANGSKYFETFGQGTSNVAEWMGLLWAMELALACGLRRALFIGDSKLVVSQARGDWRVKAEHLVIYHSEVQLLRPKFEAVDFAFVPRAQNLAGHYIERRNKQ
jgi:ribonuclease HI